MAKAPTTKSRRYIRSVRLGGLTLHVRTIIEQGRMKEFLAESKEAGFDTLKAQVGFVQFLREFVEKGQGMKRTKPITGELAEVLFKATKKSKGNKIDICL